MLLCLAAAKFARFLSIAPELRQAMEFSIGPRVASIIENIPLFASEIRENKPWSKLGLLGGPQMPKVLVVRIRPRAVQARVAQR